MNESHELFSSPGRLDDAACVNSAVSVRRKRRESYMLKLLSLSLSFGQNQAMFFARKTSKWSSFHFTRSATVFSRGAS